MLSTRSTSSEFVNSANPLGYHLGQGTLFTYVDGAEYKDIWASWDWNLIPGTTLALNKPDLSKTTVKYSGKKVFVGVVSDGHVGVAVEDYVDPFDGHISYKKAWFHLGDAVLVTVTDIQNQDANNAPTITVLDNRAKANGGAFVDGKQVKLGNDTKATGSTLLYGGNGYLAYDKPFDLTLSEGERAGNWSAISTSTLGVVTVPVFSAYTTINASTTTYALFPATSARRLAQESEKPSWIPVRGAGISGAAGQGTLGVVFWPGGDRSITVKLAAIGWADRGTVKVTAEQPGVYLLTGSKKEEGKSGMRLLVSAADPTQKLKTASLELTFTKPINKELPKGACGPAVQLQIGFAFTLPTDGLAGSSVQHETSFDL